MDAVICGRWPPIQLNAPVTRGERMLLPLEIFDQQVAAGFQGVQTPGQLNRALRRSSERAAVGTQVPGLPGGSQQQGVECDQAVGRQREGHASRYGVLPHPRVPEPPNRAPFQTA